MQRIQIDKVKHITKNTNNIQPGSAYFCFKGEKFNGHDFIQEAFNKGAVYVVGDESHNIENYIQVENVNQEMARLAMQVFNFNQDMMKFIAVTGTDGKTSTSLIISEILNKFTKASYLGTSGLFINGEELEYNGMTTPFADELYSNFATAKKNQSEYFVMEASSHSLEQERAYGLNYDIAIFTNLTSEHIDFHKTMENYYQAKAKLFDLLKPDGIGIINIDSEYGERLYNEKKNHRKLVTMGKNVEADYQITNIKETLSGTTFDLTYKGIIYPVKTKLLVEFNVYNLTQAIAALHQLGYNLETIIELADGFVVAGRMELIRNEELANVIIDFAHTPDSILKIMKFVEKLKTNEQVFVLTGTAGERDSQKRPEMGKNAARGADVLILTEDDPRSEDVLAINNDLKKGINLESVQVVEIVDRRAAIKYALTNSKNNDIIVMLGKGGQKKMYYDGYTTQYIEREITEELIKEVINERK